MKLRKTILPLVVALLSSSNAYAKLTVVSKGAPKARIVCVEDSEENLQAAALLQRFVREMSGAELPVVSDSPKLKHKSNLIYIGGQSATETEDGFTISCQGGRMSITSGGGRGSIYGVVTLLEEKFGVKYYARDCYNCPKSADLSLEDFTLSQSPAFRYRQTHSYGSFDPTYVLWHRLETPDQLFASNLWVHTFDRILPSTRFGHDHPEWYALINGSRHPGNHSQWCLSNPEVFEQACIQIDSIFRANPGMNMISVSQNDGNNTYCTCPECKAVDEYEGAQSGSLIHFLNKLAIRFPDKEFSTLAYLYSMNPPKHVKPLPNVNIMLCDIDCKRERPLTDTELGRWFVEALEGWSAISDNIFVWDYGINFDNMISPFPNFHVLQPNLQLFKKNHATMVFEQVNGMLGTDFSELRAYLLAKLLWNPDSDVDKLTDEFLEGFYGKASKPLKKYLELRKEELLASGKELWIYDSPVTHKGGMLRPEMMARYDELFDQAEAAVEGDSLSLRHVRLSRLQQQYSELEIARTEPGGDLETIIGLLETFEQRARELGVEQLNERHNSPAEYCVLYRDRFLPVERHNLAAGSSVEWVNAPAPRYMTIADKALTDGLYGGTTYVESWVGWEGEDADFIIDLGEEKQISSISIDFLHQLGAWILLPQGGRFSTSLDGVEWIHFGDFGFEEDRDISVKFVKGEAELPFPVSARYVYIHVDTLGECPSWHYGVGHPAWFFLDEVVIR